MPSPPTSTKMPEAVAGLRNAALAALVAWSLLAGALFLLGAVP